MAPYSSLAWFRSVFAAELRLVSGELLLKPLEVRSSRIVFSHTRQPKFKQLALDVVTGRRIGFRHIQARKRLINLPIERKGLPECLESRVFGMYGPPPC